MSPSRACPTVLTALALATFAATAAADPNHQGQTGTSTIATVPTAQPPQPVPQPAPQPVAQPVGYVPPPPVGGVPVYRPVGQPLPSQQPPYAPPMVASQQQRNADARPGLLGSVQGGAGIPVQGDLGTYGSVGGVGIIQGGYEFSGLSVRLELGFRTNAVTLPSSTSPVPDAETAIFYGAGLRYTFARTVVAHPFIEAYIDAFSPLISTTTGAGTSSTSRGTGLSAGGGVGLEIDLNELISLQVSARFDEVLTNAGATALTGGLTHVLLGGTYYY